MNVRGEVLLIVDGQVSDVATFDTVSQRNKITSQFRHTQIVIQHEHPESDVRIDIRET